MIADGAVGRSGEAIVFVGEPESANPQCTRANHAANSGQHPATGKQTFRFVRQSVVWHGGRILGPSRNVIHGHGAMRC